MQHYTPPTSPVIAGTVVRWYTVSPFTAVDGTPMDPDRVIFAWNIGDQYNNQVEYNMSGINTVIRESDGSYYIDLDTTGYSGLWIGSWIGLSVDGTVQTRSEAKLLVVDPQVKAII